MNEDNFDKMLGEQVRIKRRQELRTMFAGFEREQTELNDKSNETEELNTERKEISS